LIAGFKAVLGDEKRGCEDEVEGHHFGQDGGTQDRADEVYAEEELEDAGENAEEGY
jgi:hypothetical protein